MKVKWLPVILVLLLISAASAVAQQVTVVNIIPQKNSNEANDDSEPNIAVNPANPLQIVITAFTPDSSGATNKVPVFLSSDGGQTWTEASIVPVNANNNCPATCDITLRFGGSSNILYIGWLDGNIPIVGSPSIEYSILRTTPFPGPAVTVLENITESTSFRDQPFTQATTFTSGGTGNDRVYVGSNDATVDPKSATVDQSMNAGTPAPPAGLSAVRIEVRTNCGFDGPPIRPAMHSDGTVYAVFSSWTTCSATSTVADVVLVRDDNWGQGSPAYSAIKDSSDTKAGVKVAGNIAIPFNTTTGYATLGTERVGSLLSIAVDPRNSQTVYVAWGTGTSAATYSLNVARSDKGGISGSWTTVLTVSAATNPALAVTNRGTVGFLYQKLVTPGTCNAKGTATACWETHLQTSDNSGSTWTKDFTFANLPDLQGPSPLNPSIGDYDHLLAIGKDFYGVFSGFNAYATPTTTNFPQNISFQRFTDNAGNFFADAAHTTSVSNSVDPFFFQVSEPDPTTLTYQGDTSADFHDPANLSALLTDQTNGQPIASATVQFTLGLQSCTATTNASGVASCTVVLDQCSGNYTVKANFAGSPLYLASSDSKAFTVNPEETTLTYTGDTVIANGGTATMSGVLLEDNTTPVAGRTVTFTLGTGATAQTCNAVTNGSGIASCTISPVAQLLGPGVVTDTFAGDSCYRPASASANTLLFAFLASGAFVVGDQSAQMGTKVTFWGAKWSKVNSLSGGPAPASFKGFAATLSAEPPKCGITWTTGPGNSSNPPATVPAYMGVLVATKVTKSGSNIAGDAKSIVVVKTDPGYAPDPGHAGTGTVVGVFCHP